MATHDERKPRVLTEHGSVIVRLDLEEELTQAGFEVLTCAGPAHLDAGCPLLAGGECQLANDAHVILNAWVSHRSRSTLPSARV